MVETTNNAVEATNSAADMANNPGAVMAFSLDALCAAVQSSFEAMTGQKVEICLDKDQSPEEDDTILGPVMVAGLIGLLGEWKGTGILECRPELACELSNIILGMEDSVLKNDGMEAVAEMSNIVFGTLKTTLEEKLGYMGMSTPTVICGAGLGMYNSGSGLRTIPCRFGEHSFVVKLAIAKAQQRRPPLKSI